MAPTARFAIRIGDLLNFCGVFDRIAFRVFVVREQVVAEQVAARSPGARYPAFAGVVDGLDPLLPIAHFEGRMVESWVPSRAWPNASEWWLALQAQKLSPPMNRSVSLKPSASR